MNSEEICISGIINEHLYFVNEPYLYLRKKRVYGIRIENNKETWSESKFSMNNRVMEIFDPYEHFGIKPHKAEILPLENCNAWICFEEPEHGEYSGFEKWFLINKEELENLYEQTKN
jgi:hypothetical protein